VSRVECPRGEARGRTTLDSGVAAATSPPSPSWSVGGGLCGLPDAPAVRGSSHRQSHVRGSGPQCVYAQQLAPLCVRLRWHRIAENVRGSVLRRRVAGASRRVRPWRASIDATVGRRWSRHVVVGSAQTNPASSRATAAVTVDWDCLRSARWRNRRHSRSWAAGPQLPGRRLVGGDAGWPRRWAGNG
jgi:hypothetical protein